MGKKKQFSLTIRFICGVLGTLGIATIIFNFKRTGQFDISFLSMASMFALFIFLFVAIKGTNPLESDERKDE